MNGPPFDGRSHAAISGFTISLADGSHRLLESWTLPTQQVHYNGDDVAVDVRCGSVPFSENSLAVEEVDLNCGCVLLNNSKGDVYSALTTKSTCFTVTMHRVKIIIRKIKRGSINTSDRIHD